eukprot:138226-Amphidinium_carterae.3
MRPPLAYPLRHVPIVVPELEVTLSQPARSAECAKSSRVGMLVTASPSSLIFSRLILKSRAGATEKLHA